MKTHYSSLLFELKGFYIVSDICDMQSEHVVNFMLIGCVLIMTLSWYFITAVGIIQCFGCLLLSSFTHLHIRVLMKFCLCWVNSDSALCRLSAPEITGGDLHHAQSHSCTNDGIQFQFSCCILTDILVIYCTNCTHSCNKHETQLSLTNRAMHLEVSQGHQT